MAHSSDGLQLDVPPHNVVTTPWISAFIFYLLLLLAKTLNLKKTQKQKTADAWHQKQSLNIPGNYNMKLCNGTFFKHPDLLLSLREMLEPGEGAKIIFYNLVKICF